MDLQALYEQYGIYLLYVPVVIALVIGTYIFQNKKAKTNKENYLTRYPKAVKVFFNNNHAFTTDQITVYTVDNETPALLAEQRKTGFYLKPGKSTVCVSYGATQPNVMYKNISKPKNAVDIILAVEAGKQYELSYHRTNKEFELNEATN